MGNLLLKSNKGFTLIEVMVALMIFAFAATSLTVGFQSSVNASIRAEQNIQANYVAQHQIETIALTGKTDKNTIKPEIKIEMFDKRWIVKQTIESLNEYKKAEDERIKAGLIDVEDNEIISDSFNTQGESSESFKLDIPDSFLVLTIDVTPEDELGHATMQTILIKGLIQ